MYNICTNICSDKENRSYLEIIEPVLPGVHYYIFSNYLGDLFKIYVATLTEIKFCYLFSLLFTLDTLLHSYIVKMFCIESTI